MEKSINEGNQKIVYFSPKPTLSINGLYIIFAGTTMPSVDYYMTRNERSGIFWGGVYVFEYVKSGKGYIECDGNKYEVSKGDFVFMNAKRNIKYYSDKNDPYSKDWINFSGPFVKGMVDAFSLTNSVYIIKYDAQALMTRIHQILLKTNDQNRDYSFDQTAVEICGAFLKINSILNQKRNSLKTEKTTTAERIKNYIDSLLLPNVNLDDLSLRFQLDKGYIVHRFTGKYGISPYKYINSRKIEAAKKMLSDRNMKITEISDALGYSCTQHFSSSFKKATGKTPKEYMEGFKV